MYISSNNTLAVRWYSQGYWYGNDTTDWLQVRGFHPALESRALSLAIVPDTNDSELLLIFEGSPGYAKILHSASSLDGSTNTSSTKLNPSDGITRGLQWTWTDITGLLRDDLEIQDESELGKETLIQVAPPFTMIVWQHQIEMFFAAGVGMVSTFLLNGTFNAVARSKLH